MWKQKSDICMYGNEFEQFVANPANNPDLVEENAESTIGLGRRTSPGLLFKYVFHCIISLFYLIVYFIYHLYILPLLTGQCKLEHDMQQRAGSESNHVAAAGGFKPLYAALFFWINTIAPNSCQNPEVPLISRLTANNANVSNPDLNNTGSKLHCRDKFAWALSKSEKLIFYCIKTTSSLWQPKFKLNNQILTKFILLIQKNSRNTFLNGCNRLP